ncbi:hypothetical protein EXIGLDRAFT_693177 [Exidia glandulosa HHB12029]|uniref:Uncharacterized protein n=1 Tax=Exidia glandulosa HHB12029 TaxID=1314781 RepID=A0A165HGJ8_EXIGL|nr:hypothetical protein EXIGLDRAFT_702729 [Exidia glandulosa HHB12029]KZV91935.1 hypothetical protein EXIGLDRAFT_693177 [Exidia glandulosa HHB12029]
MFTNNGQTYARPSAQPYPHPAANASVQPNTAAAAPSRAQQYGAAPALPSNSNNSNNNHVVSAQPLGQQQLFQPYAVDNDAQNPAYWDPLEPATDQPTVSLWQDIDDLWAFLNVDLGLAQQQPQSTTPVVTRPPLSPAFPSSTSVLPPLPQPNADALPHARSAVQNSAPVRRRLYIHPTSTNIVHYPLSNAPQGRS